MSLVVSLLSAVAWRLILLLDFFRIIATAIAIAKITITKITPPQSSPFCTNGIGEVLGVPSAANAGGSGSTFPPWPVGGISVSGLVGESPKLSKKYCSLTLQEVFLFSSTYASDLIEKQKREKPLGTKVMVIAIYSCFKRRSQTRLSNTLLSVSG